MVILAFLLLSPRQQWETVEVPNGTTLNDVLTMDLYSPFNRQTLVDNPMDAYGGPADTGHEGSTNDQVNWYEFLGKHGRIRVYKEVYKLEYGWDDAQWLETFPGKLYLDDVIEQELLAGLEFPEKEWKLSLKSQDCSLYLIFELDGRAIRSIADMSGF